MSSFFEKLKSLPNVRLPRPGNYSPPMPSSSAVFSTKSQLWNFVAASVSHIFGDFSTLKYHHKFDKFNKVNWFLALLTHKLCVCVCGRGERGLLLLLCKLFNCFAAAHTTTRALNCLRTSSLSLTQQQQLLAHCATTFRDVFVLLLVTRRANDNWKISAKIAPQATTITNAMF